MSTKFNALVLGSAALVSGPIQAKDCTAGTAGYVEGFFSNACTPTLQSPRTPINIQATYTKAKVNGKDTGTLTTP